MCRLTVTAYSWSSLTLFNLRCSPVRWVHMKRCFWFGIFIGWNDNLIHFDVDKYFTLNQNLNTESRSWRCVFNTTLCDKVCQWLVAGQWFSPGSSTNKTDRHDIAEILLKVALNTITKYHTWIPTVRYNLSDLLSLLSGFDNKNIYFYPSR